MSILSVISSVISRTNLILTTISLLFHTTGIIDFHIFKTNLGSSFIQEEYDYIVVGAGTAGSIIANRLSKDPTVSVLLIEAGKEQPSATLVPSFAPALQKTEIDWQYQTETSSTSCLAMKENRCNFPRGKTMGGSSSINFMVYVRGNRNDYDGWRDAGNPGWGYDDVLPLFKKSEDNKDPEFAANTEYHSTGGFQKIQRPPTNTPLADAFLEAGLELGYPTADINAESQYGLMIAQGFQYNGWRQSSATAFLEPIRFRGNLDIAIKSLVKKINFDSSKRATSVSLTRRRFWFFNVEKTVKARKEIIISAGGINTPQLLMLSGIGPAAHLNSLGIEPIVDLAVGRNLQDHISSTATFTVEEPISLMLPRLLAPQSVSQYIFHGSGPLNSLGTIEAVGFVNTEFNDPALNWPDIQFQFVTTSYAGDQGKFLRDAVNMKDEVWTKYYEPIKSKDTFTVLAKLMRPQSRGYIELKSTDPTEKPKIVSNFLTEAADVQVLVAGLKLARQVGEAEAFKKFGTKFYDKTVPGCENLSGDAYLECFVRHLTYTIYHYSGTAKMGPATDSEAVVDPELKVYGTTGLRVADASIFPTIVTGNTNAAVMVVAENAAKMIIAAA